MPGWGYVVRKRAKKAHAAKKWARKQKRHLVQIKSEAERRQIMLASRRRQPRRKR
jgi:ribosomal protein L35